MATTANNQRKFKCLVATFIKANIDSIEKAEIAKDLTKGFDLEALLLAIEAVKKANSKPWHKPIDKILGEAGLWAPKEEPWVPFDDIRKEISQTTREIVAGFAFMFWSPVEVWLGVRNRQESIVFVESMLTGESYYAGCLSSNNYRWHMINPRDYPTIPNSFNPIRGAFPNCFEIKTQLAKEGKPADSIVCSIGSRLI